MIDPSRPIPPDATQPDNLVGGEEADHIVGGVGKDIIFGRGGDDRIEADLVTPIPDEYLDDDYVNAGAGNDLVEGGSDRDNLYGGTGDDQLYGNRRADLEIITDPNQTRDPDQHD